MDLNKLLEGLVSKIRLMVGRAIITAMRYDGKIHRGQLRLLADEIQDEVEYMQHYGLISAPKRGAEAAVIFLGGNRDHGIIVATHDRRYRLSVEEGEVALHDDIGQKVHLTRDGIEAVSPLQISASAPVVRLIAVEKVRAETPLFECTGEIKDLCDGGGKTMSAMRGVFNDHAHKEKNVFNGLCDQPNVEM